MMPYLGCSTDFRNLYDDVHELDYHSLCGGSMRCLRLSWDSTLVVSSNLPVCPKFGEGLYFAILIAAVTCARKLRFVALST